MFCESCSAPLDEGSLICSRCGANVRDASARTPSAGSGAAVALVATEAAFFSGQGACAAHAGMPLVGRCPRCQKQVCIRCAPDAAQDRFTCTDCEGLSRAHAVAPAGTMCAIHPESPANFICSRCGSFACHACAHLGDAGLCVRCAPAIGALASRGSRFAANLIDNFLVAMPVVVAIAALAIIAANRSRGSTSEEMFEGLIYLGMGLGMVIGCAIQLIAQFYWGQSIGKRIMSIKVVRTDGSPIEIWRLVLLRNVVLSVVAQFCGLVGLVDAVMIFGNEQRCLHDYLADSIVVEAPRG